MPSLPALSPAQQQVADALTAALGMPYADADMIARTYRGNGPAGLPEEDQPLMDYAHMFAGWGLRGDEIAGWMLAPGFDDIKKLHHQYGYTSKQYGVVGPVIEARDDADAYDRTPDASAAAVRWRELLKTVPPTFMTLCVRAGQSDSEIAALDARRSAGDPHVHGELATLAGLLGET